MNMLAQRTIKPWPGRLLAGLIALLGFLASSAEAVTVTFSSSGNWIAPVGVTSATVEAWGGGGAGGGTPANANPSKGGGGAGGQYVSKGVTVVPGTSYAVAVGLGGAGSIGSGVAGNDSTFATNVVVAKGGAGGAVGVLNGTGTGASGSATGAVGSTIYAGGNGSNGQSTGTGGAGGGGAGSTGPTGPGGNASGNTAGTGTANGGGAGGAGLASRGTGNSGVVAGGGGGGGYATNSNARNGGDGADGKVIITYAPPPSVVSINTASTNPTAANTSVSWTAIFDSSVTGVDSTDFSLTMAGGVTGATVSSVTGSGTTYTVTANTGTGTVGTLTLKLVDNDSIVNSSGVPLGGSGSGNGNFTGQLYTLIIPVCTAGMLFCDDFERSVTSGGSNTAGAIGTAPGYGAWTVSPLGNACDGATGNRGCAGIDSDVPPWSTPANRRANATRSMFTRWSNVVVTSPVIDLSHKTGAQISMWLRRGSDCFSEWPGDNQAGCDATITSTTAKTGEEFRVDYLNNTGSWITLVQYPMEDTPGQIITPTIGLPDDALHANFQFRFVQPGGSGSNSTNGGALGVRGYDYWHVDNVTMIEVPRVAFTGPFCDTFEGDLSRWDMAGTGSVRIGSAYFETGAHSMDLRWNKVSATSKSTDLSANSGNNIISFWVKRGTGNHTTYPNTFGSDYPETGKNLRFEYLNNFGTWVQLGADFLGGGTDGQVYSATLTPATNSLAIPADAKHANFKLRITMTSGSGVYDQDYWHVDNVCVGTTVGSTDLGMTMTSAGTFSPGQYVTYTMTVTNYGGNSDPGPITITDTLPVGLTFVGGSAGWSCGATGSTQNVVCTQYGGLAPGASTTLTLTVTVDATASGTIINSAILGGQANDSNSANNTATKSDTIFVPGYVFTDMPCTLGGGVIDTGAQCGTVTWSPQTAGAPLGSVYITAVDAANNPIQLNATNPTTVNMQFGLSCGNPAADAGVQATFYDAATTTLPLCKAGGATPTSWSSARALVFPAATPSVGPFSFNYNDVGSVELFMRNSAVTSQMGRSGSFVVKPAGFVLSAIKCTTANAVNCGAGALAMGTPGNNPAAANAAGTSFIPAGAQFSVTVTAVNALGNATPNFGQEGESVKLTPSNVVAGMITPPAISGTFGAFSGGVATGTAFTWGEVGIITLTPSVADGNYLGAGDVAGTISGNVGRFYPDHFDTVVTQVSGVPTSCPAGLTCPSTFNGAVYSGQTFSLTVTAKAIGGAVTQNYNTTTGFSKTTNLTPWGALGTVTAPTGAGSLGLASVTAFAAGTLTDVTEKYTFTVITTSNRYLPTAPTDIYMRASDGEASSLRTSNPTTTSIEGGVKVISGRLRLVNAYGSPLLPLVIPAEAQYYNGTNWVTDTVDASSTLSWSASPSGSTALDGANHAGSTTGTLGASLVLGLTTLTASAPGSGGFGYKDISVVVPNYLKFPWAGCAVPAACALSDFVAPSSRVSFGIYKATGSNRIIYRREKY